MDIVYRQRQLLALIRDPGLDLAGDRDPYVALVSASTQRVVACATNRSWRARALAKQAPCSVRLLEQRGRFAAELVAYLADARSLSPFPDTLADAFLARFADDADALVAAVTRFEAAVLALKRGDSVATVIDWPGDPRPLLSALIADGDVSDVPPPAMRMHVDGRLAGWFTLTPAPVPE